MNSIKFFLVLVITIFVGLTSFTPPSNLQKKIAKEIKEVFRR